MSWLSNNTDKVIDLLLSHLWLSGLPIALGFGVAVPIGWYANRHRRVRGAILSVSGVLYTIPSLALFLILPGILGTGILDATNVVVALTIYAVAIMVRSSTDAFESVSPAVLDAATASGFAASGHVTTGAPMVSVGALIGVNNLGTLFTEGYRTDNNPEIVTGVVGIVLVALAYDGLLVLGGRLLMPWATTRTSSRNAVSPMMSVAQRLRGGNA